MQEKEEKYNKLVKTMKAARTRIDTLKSEKDQVVSKFSTLKIQLIRCFSGGHV